MKVVYLALLSILIAACSRTQQLARRPILVLGFENLTGDPALDWMGRGAARQIASQIDGATIADVAAPGPERARAIVAGSTRLLHGYVSRFGDRLRLRADLEDAASGSFVQSGESTGPVSAGLLPLAAAVAHQIDPSARQAGAKSEAALSDYVTALGSPDAAAATGQLTRAIAADPDFADAYLALIELSQARHDRAAAERFLALAKARGPAIPALDRARLNVAAAQLSGNSAALTQSLTELSRLAPTNTGLLRTLASAEMEARHYGPAIDYFKKALAAQPDDPALLNLLGYTYAYAGDLAAAVKTLREYERLRPAEANPLDSLGEVNFYLGQFSEAEGFYRQAFAKDPSFLNGIALAKAATARLMTGDVSGAEAIFREYETARRAASDPGIELARAEWDRLRGKPNEAIHSLEILASTTKNRDIASLAHASLTIWLLEAGDRASARQHAAQAAATAGGQMTAGLAAACRYVADPSASSFPDPAVRAEALLLSKDFAAAVPLLREVLAHSAPSPTETTPVLLAWALEQTGQFDEAEKYLGATPIPALGPAPFEALVFPRIFHLRAIVAEKKGLQAVADQNRRIFVALSSSPAGSQK